MNLKQMQYIVEIYRCGSMHAASQKLFLSQPALSQHLQRAEEELGVRIFQRGTRRMHLTQEGQQCIETFERMLFEYRQLEQWLRDAESLNHGVLNLGIPPVRALQFLPILLPEFKKKYPGIHINQVEAASYQLAGMVRGGEVDLALFLVEDFADDLNSIPILEDELFLAVPQDSEADRICEGCVSRGEEVDIRLLADQPFILPKQGSHLRSAAEVVFARHDLHPKILMESTTVDLGVALAATGAGLTVVSRIFMYFYHSPHRPNVYSLNHEADPYRLVIASHPSGYMNNAMKAFVDFTRQKLGTLPFRQL